MTASQKFVCIVGNNSIEHLVIKYLSIMLAHCRGFYTEIYRGWRILLLLSCYFPLCENNSYGFDYQFGIVKDGGELN